MDGKIHLHETIVAKIETTERQGVILLTRLKPGTVLHIHTTNSIYMLELINDNNIFIKGGTRWPAYTHATINGSTWGGSMLWCNRIGRGMNMEIFAGGKIVTTSKVLNARIESPDEWFYDMEWNSNAALYNP